MDFKNIMLFWYKLIFYNFIICENIYSYLECFFVSWIGGISVIQVTAAGGSALTADHFGKPQRNQRALAPTLGTSLTLGVPGIRH
jgi:hypothetical protein